jgi:protein phosphatase 1L
MHTARLDMTAHEVHAAVFDGHSGDQAAQWLHDNLQEYIAPALEQTASREHALHAAFTAADVDLLHLLAPPAEDNGGDFSHAGATASVVLASPEQVTVANLGDSSVVLCRQGKDVLLSAVHRVYGRCDPGHAGAAARSHF